MKAQLHLFDNFDKVKTTNIAIGNFDGVHKGHQALIAKMLLDSSFQSLQSIIVTFTPNTKSVLRDDFELVQTYFDRRNKLEGLNISGILEITFTKEICNLSPKDFLKSLDNYLNIANIYVGKDFKFGYQGKGDVGFLKTYYGHQRINDFELLLETEIKFSSRELRDSLKLPDFDRFRLLTGYDYHITGKIVQGKQIGKKIGFPTININLDKMSLKYGVYLVKVKINNQSHFGLANFGVAPTLHELRGNCLEVHFPNKKENFYGKVAHVEFIKFLRNEKNFSDKSQLRLAIEKDLKQFQLFFENR
ncbi:MAG: hypothetical protein COB02_10715 [Candidatus Cloacimonadota bacterium]|nr:MAG: hypothetical protein COB02_10715 [Candidatus Cloacimonadota bacterium]